MKHCGTQTIETEGLILRQFKSEDADTPVARSLLLDKLKELGYGDIQVGCFPFSFKSDEIEKLDWYTVVAHKE